MMMKNRNKYVVWCVLSLFVVSLFAQNIGGMLGASQTWTGVNTFSGNVVLNNVTINGTCTGSGCGGSGGGGGTGSQYQTGVYSGTNTLGAVGPGITGQSFISNGASASPGFASPGVSGRVVTSGSTDSILCDSGTTTQDRGETIIYATGGTVTVTVPDAGSSGCGSHFVFNITVAAWPSHTASTTVTVNRTTSSTFNTATGAGGTSTASLTTLSLTTGQFATFSSPDNANYLVRIN
jgi:hypothetical protein